MASSSASLSFLNQLPSDLLLDKDVFIDVMTHDTLWNLLDQSRHKLLMDKYLPTELTDNDKEKTIEMLLSQSLTRFNNDEALSRAFDKLRLHKMSPEVVKAKEDVRIMSNKLRKLYEQKRQCQLLNEIIAKRATLFEAAIALPFDPDFHGKAYTNAVKSKVKAKCSMLKKRAKIRYHKEMKDIRTKFSSSEDDDEDHDHDDAFHTPERTAPTKYLNDNKYSITEKEYREMLRKHRRKRKAIDDDQTLYEPSLETANVTLSDIIIRVTNCSLSNNSLSSSSSLKPSQSSHVNSGKSVTTSKKRTKCSQNVKSTRNNVISNGVSASQYSGRADVESDISNKSETNANISDIKSEYDSRTVSVSRCASISEPNAQTYLSLSGVESPESPMISAPLPALPPLLSSSPEPSPLPLPLEKSPSCFFSLLRDTFKSGLSNDHRLTLHKLEELVKEKLRSIDPFIGWSSEMVASAMNYLSGVLPPPHLIPLVDYKEKNQQWQWIGGGRDLDADLIPLCEEWIKTRDDDPNANIISLSQTIPPPVKCLTDWTVRPSSEEEKIMYRQQEAVRYNNPNKAFTYRVHGYESVIGPVKGCGIANVNSNNNSSPNKAREHSLLVNDRPPFVTLLSLVRDAAARLPNGEGTRADICELLKDSQYLLPTISDQQVNGIVSGALDRLHYEKDPCVKYDVNRKVWIYLHRNRTEAEFERLHEAQIAAAKAKRSMNKSSRKNNSNSIQNTQKSQSSIISKTTQQAIHRAVTNILNSDALKVIPNQTFATTIAGTSATNTNTLNSDDSNNEPFINVKDSNDDDSKESESTSNVIESPCSATINGATSSIYTSPAVVCSIPSKDIVKCKSGIIASPTNIPLFNKKKLTKPKEELKLRIEPKINLDDSVQIPDDTIPITTQNSSLNMTALPVSSNLSNMMNHNDLSKIGSKPRQIRQPRSALRPSALNKTIAMPISLAQNQQLQHQTTATSSETIPTIIGVANPINKQNVITTTTTGATVPHQKALTTKIISHAQINNAINSPAASNTTHQISIPTSVLLNARPGSVVFAHPAMKSYLMAATGGSIVLQQNSTAPTVTMSNTTSPTQSLAVRTLQGIRVIPVPQTNTSVANTPSLKTNTPLTVAQQNNSQTIVANQTQAINSGTIPAQHHQFVARIITTAQPNRGNLPQTQIVIPSSSSLQPLFLAHPPDTATNNTAYLQHVTSLNSQPQIQKAKLAITLPPRTTP